MKMLACGRLCLAVAMVSMAFSVAAQAADWPQFQGPNRDGTSPEKGLAREWPKSGPKALWSFPLGQGYAAPVVRDGEVYILDRVEDSQDILRCLDLKTGKELWKYAYEAKGNLSHNGSRTPPTVDEKYVYSVGVFGHFYCIDRKTHEPVWHKNILTDFGVEFPGWGVVQSPSLYKDLVIVAPQAADAFVVAFKRDTGDIVWKSPSLGRVGYSTPVIATLAGIEQAVMIGARQGKVAGISLEDGSILWQYEGWQCKIPITFPTPLPDDRLFITGGYGAGSAMIQIVKENGGLAAKELFKTDAVGSQIQQPMLAGGYLYVNNGSNERDDGLLCMSLDGQIKWKTVDLEPSLRLNRGNLIFVDGLIIVLDGKTGILRLVDPSPDAFKELAQAHIFDGREMWAPMALSDGKLLLRNQQELKCLDLMNP